MKTVCAIHNCGEQPHGKRARRMAAPGLRLCMPCANQVRTRLVELPEIYEDCESALLPRHDPTLQRVSGSRKSTGVLLDEEALDIRSSILGLLASWSALVADERSVARPDRRDVTHLASFLIRHLNWLLAHPAAADFAGEIAQIATHAHRSAYTRPALRMDLGQCVHPDCTAAMVEAPPAREGRAWEIRCTAGHTWQPHQWLQLSRQLRRS